MLLTELYMLCEMSNGLLVEAKINHSQGFLCVHFIKTILKLVSNDIFYNIQVRLQK